MLKGTKTLKIPLLKTYQESSWNPHIRNNFMSSGKRKVIWYFCFTFSQPLHVLSRCCFPLHACCCFSCVWLFVTLWTVACQDPLPIGFSRKEYWSGSPCPPPGDLPDPGIKPASPVAPALQAGSLPVAPPGKPLRYFNIFQIVNDLSYLRISNKTLINNHLLGWVQVFNEWGFPSGTNSKESACNVGDIRNVDSIPGSRRSPGGGHGNPLQYSCLEKLTNRWAWWSTVHRVTKSLTRLKQLNTHTHTNTHLMNTSMC